MKIDLPEELVFQIFIRLPVKSLLRFRTACKSWFSMISSPEFISSHLMQNHASGTQYLLYKRFCSREKREIYTLYDETDGYNMSGELVFPFKTQPAHFITVGCVNGLICLWDSSHSLHHVLLWNPAIRKCFRLPSLADLSPINRTYPNRNLSFGFGFDAVTNDYKFVRLTFNFPSMLPINGEIDGRRTILSCADVFSLKNRSWRRVSDSVPLQQLSTPVFLNGALHWLTQSDTVNNGVVVTFGLNAEAFGEMSCPRDIVLASWLNHRIEVSNGSLSLLHEFCEHCYNIWVMKEYGVEESWTKLFTVELDAYPSMKVILGFSWNGGLVLFGNGRWVVYPSSEVVSIVDFQPREVCSFPHVELYLESLVLLDEEDDNSVQSWPSHGNDQEDRKRRWKEGDCSSSSGQGGCMCLPSSH